MIVRAHRQVLDIPPLRIEVTEHKVLDWVCSECHTLNQGQFPQDVNFNTQYGLRLVAINEQTLQAQNEFVYACLAGSGKLHWHFTLEPPV